MKNQNDVFAEAARMLRTMPEMSTVMGKAMASMAVHKILIIKFGITEEEAFDVVTKTYGQMKSANQNLN